MHPSTLTAPIAVMPALDLYAPISADLEEVEHILAQHEESLCGGERGRRTRPALSR